MLHFDPRPVPRDASRISRIAYIIEAALEYFVALLIMGAYLARVTASLGFSDSLTGVLSSFASLGCLFQLGSIALFRKVKRVKRRAISMHLVEQFLLVFVYLAPVLPLDAGQKTGVFLVCYCASYIICNLVAPVKTSWLMSHVPDRTRGSYTAKKEIVSLLGGMTFTYLMGNAIDNLEAAGQQREAFIIGAIAIAVLMLLDAASLMVVREQPAEKEAEGGNADVRALLRDKQFVRIMLVGVLWYVANYAATPFFGSYQIKELGFSMTFISVIGIVYSLVRVVFSPLLGRYADKTSFSRMVMVCFSVAAVSFLVNVFTVPENGRVVYTIYYCLNAVAMSGINSSLTNLIYDHVKGDNRRNALALSASAYGVCGFLSTCVMSPVVAMMQENGNRIFGMAMYPAQFVSAVAFVLTAVLVVYVRFVVIRHEQRPAA